jgi:glycerol-3-phosphate dehydrogenase
MGPIIRDPISAERNQYDLIIIGGGVYGIMLFLEASRRKLRALLLEKEDFGGATSANSLRIVHGGLRYLQSLDLHRFRESVSERRWFLNAFPEMVTLLPCLMPLYGNGLRRPSILRAALNLNDILAGGKDRESPSKGIFPRGKVIGADQTRKIFTQVDPKGLKGGAIWYDGFIPDPQRVLMTVLRWSCRLGGTALNYMEASELLKAGKGIAGLIAVDGEAGKSHEFRAPVVINASGPWCRDLSKRFDRDIPSLFKGSIAWNVLLNRKTLSEYAVAVDPKYRGGQTYFLLPWKGMLLGGTGHAPRKDLTFPPLPSGQEMDEFLGEINLSVPTLRVSRSDVLRVFAGYLPVTDSGGTRLTDREVFVDHGATGGPRGLFSVSGIKLTTARLVAQKSLDRIFHERSMDRDGDLTPMADLSKVKLGIFDFHWQPDRSETEWKNQLRVIKEEESVVHLDDLVLRRTSIGDNPDRAIQIAPEICSFLGWDEPRTAAEIGKIVRKFEMERNLH